ncbi:hypothetical protein B0H16DRAFT_1707121 [Mycena metata]|uniref:Uncharacterized protein n=1 Tax=Mycena metata TaxID=1033252 RepID=A0AAD7GKG9_9AGAR|nr:hypothetical protein B0H16DRAFT_1707121 [Mycena metata]
MPSVHNPTKQTLPRHRRSASPLGLDELNLATPTRTCICLYFSEPFGFKVLPVSTTAAADLHSTLPSSYGGAYVLSTYHSMVATTPMRAVMSLSQEGRSMRNIRSYDQSRPKPILGDEQMSRSALLGTPQLSKGDRLTGLGLRDGNVSDTKVRYGPEQSARRSEPEWTGGISKKQETTRSRTAVVGMAERELRRRDRRSGDATEERR